MQFRYDFSISELLLRVESPREIQIPDNFKPFLTDGAPAQHPDFLFHFLFEPTPGTPDEDIGKWPESSYPDFRISESFNLGKGETVFRQDSSGRGSPCRIFIPAGFSDTFCKSGNWLIYMALHQRLIEYNRFFVHASAVIYQGKAYLFSAPSGGGKSTHAALWQKHFGAKLLNGDKVLIEVQDGQCIAHGSPVAGSSGIYEKDSAPIGGIYFLKKDKQNTITPVSPRIKMLSLYSEAIKSNQDPAFNQRLLDLIEKLQTYVPVFSLACLPEKSAVECVLHNNEGMRP